MREHVIARMQTGCIAPLLGITNELAVAFDPARNGVTFKVNLSLEDRVGKKFTDSYAPFPLQMIVKSLASYT